jgi:hypothetical protein
VKEGKRNELVSNQVVDRREEDVVSTMEDE